MKIKENMNIFTIRKKILLASKLIGVVLIISYVLSTKLPMDTDISFVIWLAFVWLRLRFSSFSMPESSTDRKSTRLNSSHWS